MHFSILPSKSVSELIISNCNFSLKSIATPDDFRIGPECQRDFPFHSFSHLKLISGVVCISCNRTSISGYVSCHDIGG